MAGGNGSAQVEVTPGWHCGDGERLKAIEVEHTRLQARDDQQEEAILQLAVEVSQARKTADLVAERVGVMHQDGTATPRSLTSLVLNLTGAVTKLSHKLDRARDSVHHLENESEITRIQSREQLIERARKAEADARKSVPPKTAWQRDVVKIALWATLGGGLVETVRRIVEVLQ